MNRKILPAGPVTLAVSLPSSWVKRFNLKKGEELYVEEQGSSLRISTQKIVEEESALVNVKALMPFTTKIIGILYQMGYKKIKAIYNPQAMVYHRNKQVSELDMIKNTFSHLTGMQLWEIKKNGQESFAVAVQKAQVESKEFENTFHQLYFHLLNQAEQVIEVFSGRQVVLEECYVVETLINQTADFCMRILVSLGYPEYQKTSVYYTYTWYLESIGDKYYSLISNFYRTREKIEPKTMALIKESLEFLRETASLQRKFELGKIILLTKKMESITKDYEKFIGAKKKVDLYSYDIYFIIKETYELIEIIYCLNYDYFREKSV